LWSEGAFLTTTLRSWRFWLILSGAALLWATAYQAPTQHRMAFGGDPSTQRRYDDTPFIRGFNAAEPASTTAQPWWTQMPYRWATPEATMVLPGLSSAPLLVEMRAAGHPNAPNTLVQVQHQQQTTDLLLTPQARRYQWLGQPTSTGDLELNFSAPAYQPTNDPRDLGFVAFTARIATINGLAWPAFGTLGWLLATLALTTLIIRRLTPTWNLALAFVTPLVLLVALLLTSQRAGLAVFAPSLCMLVAGCYLVANSLTWFGRRWLPHPQLAWLSALIVLAFAIRLGGMLHPHTRFSDLGLNANNLFTTTLGNVISTERLPGRAGGGEAPYPPGQYLLLAPTQLLLEPDSTGRELAIMFGAALLDALVLGGVWCLARTVAGYRVAWFAALLYLLPRPILLSFSVGEFANLYGQSLALPLLGLLALAGHQLQRSRFWLAGIVLVLFGLTGHSGVSISLSLLLGSLGLIWLGQRWRSAELWRLVSMGFVGYTLTALIYYSAFLHLVGAADTTPSPASGNPLERVVNVFLNLERGNVLISPLLLLLGLLGLIFLLGSQRSTTLDSAQTSTRQLLAAWWLAAGLSLAPLLFSNQTVRWSAFLAPALAICAGVGVARFWRRGLAARSMVVGGLGLLMWIGANFWVERLRDYLHE
jgi:hypothetical protein